MGLRELIGLALEFVYMISLFAFMYLFTGSTVVKLFL